MRIEKVSDGTSLTLSLNGRLDTTTAPALEQEARASLEGVTDLTVDMSGLEYISSAGLRVLLLLQKTMNKQGSMAVIHANEMILDVFRITGFSDILTLR